MGRKIVKKKRIKKKAVDAVNVKTQVYDIYYRIITVFLVRKKIKKTPIFIEKYWTKININILLIKYIILFSDNIL